MLGKNAMRIEKVVGEGSEIIEGFPSFLKKAQKLSSKKCSKFFAIFSRKPLNGRSPREALKHPIKFPHIFSTNFIVFPKKIHLFQKMKKN
jgi:hypothetical protein